MNVTLKRDGLTLRGELLKMSDTYYISRIYGEYRQR